MGLAYRHKWIAHAWLPLGLVALPILCLLASDQVGASMFIAAFVAGLAVQVGFRGAGKRSIEFTEGWGQVFNLSVFFLFGMLVGRAWPQFQAVHLVYALFSLTIVRMVPVALCLIGTRLHWSTVLFMGWFGPRGLASIVLGLVYLEQAVGASGSQTIRLVVMAAVLVSIFAHGLSAVPGMDLYARQVQTLPPTAPEHATIKAKPTD